LVSDFLTKYIGICMEEETKAWTEILTKFPLHTIQLH
jgi:phosphoribosylanthranilate isomerase